MLRWITILLCFCGIAVAVWAVAESKDKPRPVELARAASVNPYANGIAALGFIEPSSRNIAIAAPEAALVSDVFAQVGDRVKKGQPLMQLDTRRIQADLIRAESAVKAAEAEIERWHQLPRVEDIPPLEAAAARARAVLDDRMEQEKLTLDALKRGAATDRDVSIARFASNASKAQFDEANAALARLKAGGWRPDLTIAQASLDRANAEVEALKLLRERMTVLAPSDATVLRRETDPGEFASVDPKAPDLILGDLDRLHVRAQIDEEDIFLLGATLDAPTPQPKALARTRGAVLRDLPLRLVRIEPFARPKTNLTGDNTERTDTRVVDVIFEITDLAGKPLYPGQAVDVFVEVPRPLIGGS